MRVPGGPGEVLGITVSAERFAQWREWFTPGEQPFRSDVLPEELRIACRRLNTSALPMEIVDVFSVYRSVAPEWILLTGDEFAALPAPARRALACTRRDTTGAVLWPDHAGAAVVRYLLAFIEKGMAPSEHHRVREETWERCATLLPSAHELAGTFPSGSGPNCFGTVMAAAGVPGADGEWMQREPVESWLAEHTERIRGTRHDAEPGVILAWRNEEGILLHACVTLGDGWVLNKPSQAWFSPRVVWPLRTAIRHARQVGARLERHLLRT